MTFLSALKNITNNTRTFNGAVAQKSTDSYLVDLFGTIGAMRGRREQEVENMFSQAFAEDRLLAMKLLFYARDIRSGLGERRVARILYKHLALLHPEVIKKNLSLISHYGRWDDLLVLLDTPLAQSVIDIVKHQLEEDLESETPSLLAKWLPSINTSSEETRRYARMIHNGLGWNAKRYRQTLSELRRKIDVLEVKMSGNAWTDIHYSHVPSNAMNNYSRAFAKHDEERFLEYINAVKEGRETINATVLYPYNITEKILYGNMKESQNVFEQQWNHLPDFVAGSERNILVMADVSGSMAGRPMATSIGLALYFAERSNGMFAGHFMTFSESPSLVKVTGQTLYERVMHALASDWGMNTNFEKALQVILQAAVKNHAMQSEIPETLIVVSDMQFDDCHSNAQKGWTFYKNMERMYKLKGYKIPEIVFWNVNSLSNVFQASANHTGVKIASGQSVAVFKSILNSEALTSYDFMRETLENERYKGVLV